MDDWRERWRGGVPHMDYDPWGRCYAHRHRRFDIVRRLFWFGFGAFTTMAWARHHGWVQMSHEGGRGRGEWDGGWYGSTFRRVEWTPRMVPEDEKYGHRGRWGHHRRRDEQQPAPEQLAPAPPAIQSVPVQASAPQYTPAPHPPPPGSTIPVVEQKWEADMRAFTRQASDRVTEMSEATIDSLVHGLHGLRTRLAEHRAETQKHLAEEERKRRQAAQAGQALALPVQQQSPSGSQPPRLV